MATFPASGYYLIKDFPFKVDHPETEMKLTLSRIGAPENLTYKLYCQMRCSKRSWDQGTTYSVSFVAEYYNNSGTKISEQTLIDKKPVYKPTAGPSSLWGKGKMYNWNFTNNSTSVPSAQALGLTQMGYSSALNTAKAEGLKLWSNYLTAGEPWGIRYLSDNPPTVVYAPQNKSYKTYIPTNKDYSLWPSGFGRSDSDQGVQFVLSPPDNAAYFIGRVEWWINNSRKDYYRFPQDGGEIPEDQKIETYSKLYYKNGSWQDVAYAWYKDNGTWVKKYAYNKNGSWNKKG